MNRELLQSFQAGLRYRQAPSLAKPLANPARFFRNQLRQKIRRDPGMPEKVDTFHMKDFTIVSGEIVSEGLACYGFMEPELTGAILHLVKPGDHTVDIGMHLGYFTTLLATLVGPEGRVHSFEPTPSTRELAFHNTSRFPWVTVHPNAMWSHRTEMKFHDYGIKHMAFNSFTSARLDHEFATVKEHTVEAVSLDSFREVLSRRINFIKIDAETAEEQILHGAERLLSNDRPVLSLEIGDEAGELGRSRKLIELLESMDYTPWEFLEHSFKRHQIRDAYIYDNLIFAPAGKSLA
jgi:FkbM family methyltransferase